MQSIEEIEKKIKNDINETKFIQVRKDYKTPQEMRKFLIVKHILKADSYAKVVEILVNEKFNQIQFAGVRKNGE